jgi:hypothetical protein
MKAFAKLTAVVLVVIGIGVGIVAATEITPTYGPPNAQFTASFPAQPQLTRGCPSTELPTCPPGISEMVFYQTSTGRGPEALVNVWLGTVASLSTVNKASEWAHAFGFPLHLVPIQLADDITGFQGFFCAPVPQASGRASVNNCVGIQVEGNSHTVWAARVTGSRAEVNDFLASFHPLV